MRNNLYVLLNNLSCRYGDVYVFPTDAFAVSRLTTYLRDGQKLDLKEFNLFRCGSIDITTGMVEGCPLVPVSWLDTSNIEQEVK